MKWLIVLFSLGLWLVPTSFAQESEHVQVGVFADYFQLSQAQSNFAGIGGRVGVAAWHHLKLEGELAYNFDATVFSEVQNVLNGNISKMPLDLWMLHGEFGPKLNLGRHRVHTFVFLKGGFIDYRFGHVPTTLSGVENTLLNFGTSTIKPTIYPGGGLEGHLGHLGLRLDIGDELYFSAGARNNLRVDFGPFIRF